ILLFISYLFSNIAEINKIDGSYIYLYGVFIFLSVYALTELMDRNPYAIFWESLKNIFGLALLYKQGDWFGAAGIFPYMSYMLIGYFILSLIVSGYFVYLHRKEDRQFSII
ncbi:MAG TPA: hypothetical protein VET23_10485, partial [Chitinophagaceae bacterium]|nr:hypothetical protein [Chitinophagaceae bacterium]